MDPETNGDLCNRQWVNVYKLLYTCTPIQLNSFSKYSSETLYGTKIVVSMFVQIKLVV